MLKAFLKKEINNGFHSHMYLVKLILYNLFIYENLVINACIINLHDVF